MRNLLAALAITCAMATVACTSQPQREATLDQRSSLRSKLDRADLAIREARLTDAESLYRDLATSHPRLPEVWLQLGNIYARQSQLEAATYSYKQGLRFNPEDGRLWHNLALLELRQSIRTLETASELLPSASPQRTRIEDLHRALLLTGHEASPGAR
jgi:Tfp pilus assembly protein PilF